MKTQSQNNAAEARYREAKDLFQRLSEEQRERIIAQMKLFLPTSRK